MEGYIFWDDDIEKAVSCARIGNTDCYEIVYKDESKESLIIHKNDVVHLAKCFGLVVFERSAQL